MTPARKKKQGKKQRKQNEEETKTTKKKEIKRQRRKKRTMQQHMTPTSNHQNIIKKIIKDNQHNYQSKSSMTIKYLSRKQASKLNLKLTIIDKNIKSNQSKTSDLLVSFDITCWAC